MATASHLIKRFKHTDWVKVWSGRWSLHSDSHFGEHWTIMDKIAGKAAYKQVIYLFKDGITDCWVSEAGKNNLGKRLLVEVNKNNKFINHLATSLKKEARRVSAFIKSNSKRAINLKSYDTFWQLVGSYYLPHLSVKYIVDYLSPGRLKIFLPILEEARLYAEPVFKNTEDFMERIAKRIAKDDGYKQNEILCTLNNELRLYLKGQGLPARSVLAERYLGSAIIFDLGKYEFFRNKREVRQVEKIISAGIQSDEIRGQVAYGGKVTGRVRVVINPRKNASAFKGGEILVAGNTRPEFLPIMKKAAAFVTDAGGILSHTAIVAREMKKPCVIGTKIATRVLKDGDLVEVDADHGCVKKLK